MYFVVMYLDIRKWYVQMLFSVVDVVFFIFEMKWLVFVKFFIRGVLISDLLIIELVVVKKK